VTATSVRNVVSTVEAQAGVDAMYTHRYGVDVWFEMRTVGLDFQHSARKRYVVECYVDAPRIAVWAAFADPTTWRHWWPGVISASYGTSPKPYGVGTFREATVGRHKYEERIVAWEEGLLFAYYIARATLPIADAQLECTELSDDGAGTRVAWTIAHDPRLLLRLSAPIFPRIMSSMLAKAMFGLDIHLRSERAVPAVASSRTVGQARG
jgi:uncharacterized protein YndB with AHSA1/START domain